MKDKIKLNNALDNIDERFIEEAANISRKHEHSAPTWLKYAAIPAGCTAAAAAALVCILAAGSNKSRGVDLVAQSNPSSQISQISQVSQTSQTEFSAADAGKNSGEHFAYYDFESATLELNVDDGTFTLYPVDNLNLILIPSGNFTVSENYISLYFTQFDDVKYRGRLSGDGREITILNPDEWLYSYMYLKITPPTGEALNDGYVIDYPEIVFRYYDGTPLLVSGTSESVENVESAKSAETSAAEEIIADSESPESVSRFGWVVGGDGGEISEMMYGYGGYYAHKGIDIAADIGTPALAGDDGTVILADWYYGYGRCVMIDHGDLVTLYAHLDEISVTEGQEVSRGDIIGTVGKTGEVSNPSLHFEVRQRISGESAGIAEVIETGETSESSEYEYLNPTDYLPQHRMAASLRISE